MRQQQPRVSAVGTAGSGRAAERECSVWEAAAAAAAQGAATVGGRPSACAQISDVQRWLRSAGAGAPSHKRCQNCSAEFFTAPPAAGEGPGVDESKWCMYSMHRAAGTASRHSRGNRRLSTIPPSSLLGRPTTGFSNHSRCRVPLRQAEWPQKRWFTHRHQSDHALQLACRGGFTTQHSGRQQRQQQQPRRSRHAWRAALRTHVNVFSTSMPSMFSITWCMPSPRK